MFILSRGLRKLLAASSTTMESLPLKELDFGLRKPTGPSSGVVASMVLVSPGLDWPGVSLAEVCGYLSEVSLVVAWSLMCNNFVLHFHELDIVLNHVEHVYLTFNKYFLYHRNAHCILYRF